MAAHDALYESHIPGLKLLGRGKVRDLYEVDDERLLIVTSDRLSAYDVVMQEPVPGKGRILTAMSMFWFDMMADIIPNQLVEVSFQADPLVSYGEKRRLPHSKLLGLHFGQLFFR